MAKFYKTHFTVSKEAPWKTKITRQMFVGEDEMFCEWFKCPNCDNENIMKLFEYCPNCGIRIYFE